MRVVYATLVIAAFVMMSFGTGIVRAILMSLAVLCLGVGLYLFIRHDMTTYTYIVLENEDRLDFYIDKATGKRGAYVCYYPLSEVVGFEKYERGTKKALREKYGKVFVYHYSHNRFCDDKYILVFQNEGYCDAVICQFDPACVEYLNKGIALSKEKKEEATEE